MNATRVELESAGARATRAEVGPFELQLLAFQANHRIAPYPVERGYLVVVLSGSVAKVFGRVRWSLARESFATMPPGSEHTSSFGPSPTTVLCVRGRSGAEDGFGRLLRSLRHVRASASTALGWRIASELRARDVSWPLATEGLVLQLLATAGRASEPRGGARRQWLADVRDQLHEQTPATMSLSELAASVGVHPAHLARSFRREYGITVGDYARGLRLEWAATQLALRDASLAQVAVEAGFADQSHFTRAFRRHAGVPPGRYRRLVRA